MDKSYSIEQFKTIVSSIAAYHGVERVFLFGSYARGDARPDSDIDLRIDQGRIRDLVMLGDLYADLEEALGVSIDLLTTKELDDAFLQEIASEEVLLYERG